MDATPGKSRGFGALSIPEFRPDLRTIKPRGNSIGKSGKDTTDLPQGLKTRESAAGVADRALKQHIPLKIPPSPPVGRLRFPPEPGAGMGPVVGGMSMIAERQMGQHNEHASLLFRFRRCQYELKFPVCEENSSRQTRPLDAKPDIFPQRAHFEIGTRMNSPGPDDSKRLGPSPVRWCFVLRG